MSNENKTALTAEEIKEEFYKCMPFKDVKLTSCDEDAIELQKYWHEVKQEILNL